MVTKAELEKALKVLVILSFLAIYLAYNAGKNVCSEELNQSKKKSEECKLEKSTLDIKFRECESNLTKSIENLTNLTNQTQILKDSLDNTKQELNKCINEKESLKNRYLTVPGITEGKWLPFVFYLVNNNLMLLISLTLTLTFVGMLTFSFIFELFHVQINLTGRTEIRIIKIVILILAIIIILMYAT